MLIPPELRGGTPGSGALGALGAMGWYPKAWSQGRGPLGSRAQGALGDLEAQGVALGWRVFFVVGVFGKVFGGGISGWGGVV